MQPMLPKKPFGWVAPWARAYARQTYEGVASVAVGCKGDIFAPNSPDPAGSCRDPASPMPARAYPPADHTGQSRLLGTPTGYPRPRPGRGRIEALLLPVSPPTDASPAARPVRNHRPHPTSDMQVCP